MANISITIPDDKVSELLDAFATEYGYQDTIGGQPNPQTKAQFAKSKLIEFMKSVYKSSKIKAGSATVITSADDDTRNLNLT